MTAEFCFACLALACSAHGGPRTRIWIDSDPSIGAPYREVDDAFALVLAFHSPEVEIAGISTTFGNAALPRTTAVARDLARRFGGAARVHERDVYPGARNPTDQRTRTPAADALAAALEKGRLTYLALGPLTNLATFLKLHPELAPRIDRVIFVGGQTPGRPMKFGALQIHDANVLKDRSSVRFVLNSRIRVVLAAPEISGQLVLTRETARKLKAGGPAEVFLERNSRFWLWFWTAMIRWPGGPLFDSLGVLAAVRPELVPTELRYAQVSAAGELIASRELLAGAQRVRFCADISAAASRFAFDRLASGRDKSSDR
jgi:pyrimidine-specific ribonucleoside hydrolase